MKILLSDSGVYLEKVSSQQCPVNSEKVSSPILEEGFILPCRKYSEKVSSYHAGNTRRWFLPTIQGILGEGFFLPCRKYLEKVSSYYKGNT